MSAAALIVMAACGGAATVTPVPATPQPTLAQPSVTSPAGATPVPGATAAAADDENYLVSYSALVRQVFSDVADLTRILSDVSIQLGSKPEVAPQAAALVNTTKGTFELVREQLELRNPPPGHEELHRLLLESLSFYARASAELLPDPETQMADYWEFQGLMQEGGENFHAAGAEFDKLRR